MWLNMRLRRYNTRKTAGQTTDRTPMNNHLSVYRHPTLTVLIDDSRSFLDSLAFHMNPHMARKLFHDPLDALEWMGHAHAHPADPIHAHSDEQSEFFKRHGTSIDLDRIHHIALNRQRFDMPSVLVIDYAMPQMNGVEFCQAVQSLPCKRILLTGQADEKIAVDAFNRKLIDRFIRKNDPHALDRLEAEITGLQRDFFNERTSTLKELLSRDMYSFLSDPAVEALAGQLCSRYRFVEYYLFPHPAGILFFDMHGKATLMVLETKAGLISHFEVAQDQGAPPELLTALKSLQLLPFFSDTDGMYGASVGHDWLSYCLPPQICRGRQDYYWALFDLPPHYLNSPVYSYAEFLRDRS